MVIRDQANQQQDVEKLSRDTDNANGSIGPIFDKKKEQNRLIGEIVYKRIFEFLKKGV